MPVVQPSQRKALVWDTPGGLEIVIPAKRVLFAKLFLPIWLLAWLWGEIMVIGQLASGAGNGGTSTFLLVWLAFWTVGGALAIWALLWMNFGKERVTLSATTLGIRRELLGVGRSREYELTHVRNLRVSLEPFYMISSGHTLRPTAIHGGSIAFDHGASTVRFGAALDEAEASQILADLNSRHSFSTLSGRADPLQKSR